MLVTAAIATSGMGALAGEATGLTAGPAVGVVADITWGTSRSDIDRTVAAMASAGVRWVRANMSWSGGEPETKGVLNEGWLVEVDYAVTRARAAGLEVLMPISDGVPYWASGDPAKYEDAAGPHWNKYWKPAKPGDYADFVRAMVNRYKVMGVHTYEVWNEPNHTPFWPSGPNPADYTALLAAAYPAIKAADPGATVLLGGLSKNDYDYLAGVYAAGGRAYFDAVAIHPYTGIVDPTWCWNQAGTTRLAKDAFCGIEEVRRTMEANGDAAKSIWLTEFGWSTNIGSYGVSEATQATFLTAAFTKLQTYPYVATAFWYNFRNNYWLNNDPADYEANLGLIKTDFSTKPAYTALQAWTGGPTTATTVAPATTTTTAAPATTTTTVAPVASDTQAPTITNVGTSRITRDAATITWTTNEPSSSRVEYWPAAGPSRSVTDPRMAVTHAVVLTGLTRGTTYQYRVLSTDAAGNVGVGPAASFTTKR